MEQEDFEVLRGASVIAGMVSRRANMEIKGASMRAVALRVPYDILAEVDAMATMATRSRNSMLVHLLQSALEEVHTQLDPDTRRELNDRKWQNLQEFKGESTTQEDV